MMKVEILTPKGIEFDREVKEIIIPTRSGQISVLPHHVPLISVLKAGKMRIVTEKEEIEKEIEGGILEVCKDKAVILLKKF
ncbi:MAG: ATP synthase F1 subunit epsilon [Candidatus Pacebacteria bacterium]|jgi:F-type H+-transporting ATPase subunit epsilon|nr:ATP synthase F1 subunit epsilon [Candidatus Paceibacterota bacterium]